MRQIFVFPYTLRMPDKLTNPNEYLRARLKHVLMLLDKHELSAAAAFVAHAIDVIPANDDS